MLSRGGFDGIAICTLGETFSLRPLGHDSLANPPMFAAP